MSSRFTDRLRALGYRQLEPNAKRKDEHPVLLHTRNLASLVNELLGQPLRPVAAPPEAAAPPPVVVVAAAAGVPPRPPLNAQAPVVVYFDGKDHRTKAKVEELLRGKQIVFQVLDVTDDEAERSWIITASKQTELPVVVIAGTPVGGINELIQLEVTGELKRLVFDPR